MEDITEHMLEFKEAIRHTWNTYFASSDEPMSPQVQDAFRSVELGLFSVIVLAPFGMSQRADEYRTCPLPFIVIHPAQHLQELPLLVFEEQQGGGNCLVSPRTIAVNGKATFEFFDYFDWYSYRHVDFPYVRARVVSLVATPEMHGSLVLIEQMHCRFALVEPGGPG